MAADTADVGIDAAIAGALRPHPEVATAWLFGSRARGDAKPDSDLDVALLLRHEDATAVDHHRLLRDIALRLEDASGGCRVDLVVLEQQGPVFCHHVLSEGRLVWDADPDRRIDFTSTAYTRYLDFYPTWKIAAASAISGLREWLETRR
jgi:predicted nucleotidyltransferase